MTYNWKHVKLGKAKLESLWYGPYIVSKFLEKGDYELMDYDGISFSQSRNRLYLKRYYVGDIFCISALYIVYMYIFYS